MAANKKNDNTTSILMIIVGIAFAFLSFMYVFKPCINKAKEYNKEVDVLDQTIASREDKVAKKAYYEEQTEINEKAREKVMKYFPADIKAEDDLLFCKEIEDSLAFYYTTKGTFNNPIIFYADNASSLIGYTRVCDYDFAASYDSLKEMVDFINYYKFRRAITDLKVAYESGVLTGTMTVNEYYVVGGGNEYKSPTINNVTIGNDNPFNTLDNVTRDDYDIIFK